MRIKISGVYKIINTINDHFYIGSTLDTHRRWLSHKNELKHKIHYNSHLQNAVNKYGIHNFKFVIDIVLTTENPNLILEEEQKLLDIHFGKSYCYNISKNVDKLYGEYNPFYGKKHSKETIDKLKNDIRVKHCGSNHYLFGKHKSEESKLNQHNSMIGRYNGENNPRFNNTLYTFKNIKTYEIFTGTRYQFYTKYNLHKGEVSSLINKKHNCKSVKSWILLE